MGKWQNRDMNSGLSGGKAPRLCHPNSYGIRVWQRLSERGQAPSQGLCSDTSYVCASSRDRVSVLHHGDETAVHPWSF